MNLRQQLLRAAIAPLLLCAITSRADDAAPRLTPGETFSIRFPDLPPTFYRLDTGQKIPTQMTVFLPTNYDRNRQHPLLIFLEGGNGGGATNPKVARALSEEKDFVCVSLPLFKEKLDPPAPGNGTSRLILQANDCRFMWSFYKVMLAKLEATVPNIDPAHRVLGGSSNGAHATAGLIDQSDGEIARRFSAFFFGEGGGRLEHYDLLKGKPFLMLYGSDQSGKRAKEIYAAAVTAGAKATLHEMKNAGHAFPESQYPAVRAWLRGMPLPALEVAVATTAAEGGEAEQTKTGTVKKVDVDAKQVVVMAARELTFTITDRTQIQQHGKPMQLSDLKVNANVTVDYVKDGDQRTARKIVILKDTPAAGESIPIPLGAPVQTATTHPMKYYISLPRNWSAIRTWPVLVAPNAHYGGQRKHIASFAAERDARQADLIIVAPLVINADRVADMAEYRGAVADAIRAADAAHPDGGKNLDRNQVARAKFDSEGIRAVLKDVQKLYRGEDKVYITGFSSSTHIASMFLFAHPELLKGVIINSGGYAGRGVDESHIPFLNSPERATLPVKFIVGENDPFCKSYLENWQETKAKLLRYGHPASRMQTEVIKPGNPERLSAGHNWFPTRIFDFCAAGELALHK